MATKNAQSSVSSRVKGRLTFVYFITLPNFILNQKTV